MIIFIHINSNLFIRQKEKKKVIMIIGKKVEVKDIDPFCKIKINLTSRFFYCTISLKENLMIRIIIIILII